MKIPRSLRTYWKTIQTLSDSWAGDLRGILFKIIACGTDGRKDIWRPPLDSPFQHSGLQPSDYDTYRRAYVSGNKKKIPSPEEDSVTDLGQASM